MEHDIFELTPLEIECEILSYCVSSSSPDDRKNVNLTCRKWHEIVWRWQFAKLSEIIMRTEYWDLRRIKHLAEDNFKNQDFDKIKVMICLAIGMLKHPGMSRTIDDNIIEKRIKIYVQGTEIKLNIKITDEEYTFIKELCSGYVKFNCCVHTADGYIQKEVEPRVYRQDKNYDPKLDMMIIGWNTDPTYYGDYEIVGTRRCKAQTYYFNVNRLLSKKLALMKFYVIDIILDISTGICIQEYDYHYQKYKRCDRLCDF
jgi:hypothetical protein